MTLKDDIFADPTLKQFAIDGRDGDIARAMTKASTATPLSIEAVIGALSAESAAKLASNPNLTDIRDKIQAGDLDAVRLWAGLFAKGKLITAEEYAALTAAIDGSVSNAVTVSVDAVNKALRPHRRDGKAGQKNWIEEG